MPTQPPALGGMGYENQPKCGDARQLEIKADMALSSWSKILYRLDAI